MFINFFFEKKDLEKILCVEHEIHKDKAASRILPSCKSWRLLVWVGVLGQLLVKEFVDDGGDVGGLQILGLHPDLVPPLNIGLHLF